MKKELREKVWLKYDKHCAYCGIDLEYKDMQVDHIFPKTRAHFYKASGIKLAKEVYGLIGNSVDDFENLNPSCRQCNHYKRALDLETFRTVWLGKIHERIEKIYIVKVAINYGIVNIIPFDGKFYFEKQHK